MDRLKIILLEFVTRRCIALMGLRQNEFQFATASRYNIRNGRVTVIDIIVDGKVLLWLEYDENFNLENHRRFEVKTYKSLLRDFLAYRIESRTVREAAYLAWKKFGSLNDENYMTTMDFGAAISNRTKENISCACSSIWAKLGSYILKL